MNKLEELIQELCPDGVEYKTIEELCEVQNGYTPSKKISEYWDNCDFPWFRMEDIRANGKELSDSIQHVNLAGVKGEGFPAYSIIFATTATIGEHALITVPFICNQQLTHIHIKEDVNSFLDIRFLFYYSDIIDELCKKNTKGGSTLPAVSLDKFKKFLVPVPPLEIQREIVRILDNFTSLKAELQAELQARKKQYEYYRDTLLIPPHNDAEQVTLSDVVNIKNGKDYKHLSEGIYPVYGSGGVMTYVSEYAYNKPSVLIPRKGSLNNLFYVEKPFWNVDTVFYTEINEKKIIPKYLFYLLQKEHLESLNKAGGVPSLTQSVLNKVKLNIPPLDMQKKIVDCLDNFEKICSDLNIGLPAEIEARQKQYEYYRDALLSFDNSYFVNVEREREREMSGAAD